MCRYMWLRRLLCIAVRIRLLWGWRNIHVLHAAKHGCVNDALVARHGGHMHTHVRTHTAVGAMFV